MTEPEETQPPEDAAQRRAEWYAAHAQLRVDRYAAHARQFERRMKRRAKLARWFLIPYALFAGLSGWGIGMVLDHRGMGWTGLMLAAGYAGLLSLQWIQPELLRRGDLKDATSRD